ncbi:NADH flavin oxidoreductase/12-oxophytodienoate reductase [Lineolata rhizophorae]|uniref:NADH flavin oxidoreductase/12-oxophytodienoate reductase n=1 Tax=Lineolata rhizophorae TaxID=578093 RepID=A0A6A6P8F8_9PEZI|nr:NADH flavin oxidoreductase/12-oxophytodienoate reductase [Lineolata rhizophorae]
MGSLPNATNAASSTKLFQPLRLGANTLSHRVVLAPLTRFRATTMTHIPLPMVAEYYAQRASSQPGGLLITEATFISPRASGYPNPPAIWNDEQITAWKRVTEAVHARGGIIFMQLWALGRVAVPEVLAQEGELVGQKLDLVSAGDLAAAEDKPKPRPLTEDEIWGYVGDFATAAKNAVERAGFDGIEIHGANGYLVDQFIQDVSNNRTDAWGGSIENRARFPIEIAKAVAKEVGPERTAIRLSPYSEFQGMRMEDPVPQFSAVLEGLKPLGLAYVHMVEARVSGNIDVDTDASLEWAIKVWDNASPMLLAGGYLPDGARETVDEKYPNYDLAIVFGRYFISNPDLPFRVKNGIPLAKYNRDTFYNAQGERGYIDEPFSKEFMESEWGKKVLA